MGFGMKNAHEVSIFDTLKDSILFEDYQLSVLEIALSHKTLLAMPGPFLTLAVAAGVAFAAAFFVDDGSDAALGAEVTDAGNVGGISLGVGVFRG